MRECCMHAAASDHQQEHAHYDGIHKGVEIPRSHPICTQVLMDIYIIVGQSLS